MATCAKTSPSCCEGSVPCKHIRQAVNRRHHACVKHFWGLRDESDVEEKQLLQDAVFFAVRNGDTESFELLLSNDYPWERRHIRSSFRIGSPFKDFQPWAKWRDIYQIALEYKLPAWTSAFDMLKKAMECSDWDFLKKAQEYGYNVEKEANIYFAKHPDVAALKAFLAQDAFSTINFTWLTPQFAVERSDPALLEVAHQLQGTQVAHDLAVTAAGVGNLSIH